MTGLTGKTSLLLGYEKAFALAVESTPEFEDLNDSRKALHKHLLDIGNNSSIDEILAVELTVLKNERKHYSNSKSMTSSIEAGIHEMEQCQYMLEVVRNPERYAEVNRSLALPKSRKGYLPMDDARKAFRGHATRLTNQDRSRLTEPEKKNLTVRHRNLGIVEKAYINLQNKALGFTPKQQEQSAGMEL